jgi:hypothetical protein
MRRQRLVEVEYVGHDTISIISNDVGIPIRAQFCQGYETQARKCTVGREAFLFSWISRYNEAWYTPQ